MTIATSFTWLPDAGARLVVKPSVTVAKFGDGYEQRSPHGLNTLPKVWSCVFTRKRSIGLQILNFIQSHGGAQSFGWTDPLNTDGVYVCRTWSMTSATPEIMEITCDFEQVFES